MTKFFTVCTFFVSIFAFADETKYMKIELDTKIYTYADCHAHGSTLLTRVTYDAYQLTSVEVCKEKGLVHGPPIGPIPFKCQKKGGLTYIIQYASPELTFEEVCGFSESE